MRACVSTCVCMPICMGVYDVYMKVCRCVFLFVCICMSVCVYVFIANCVRVLTRECGCI